MSAAAETQSNTPSYLVVIGVIAFAIYSYVSYKGDSTGLDTLYLLGALQIAPMLISFVRGRFSFLDFVLFSHFVIFTFARFNLVFNLGQGLTWDVGYAAEELAKCTAIMFLGGFITRNLFFRSHFAEVVYEPIQLSANRHLFLLSGLLAMPFILNYVPPTITVPILSMSAVIQILIFTCVVPERPYQVSVGRMLLFLSAIHHFLESGFMSVLVQFTGIAFIFVCLKRRTAHLVGLLMLALVLSAIQSVKGGFREALAETYYTTTVSERIQLMADLLAAKYGGHGGDEADDERDKALAQGFSRLGDNSLETVLVQTPALVPFWEGETYSTIPFMFIPRLLWPDKPARNFWNKYGRLYGILSEDDVDTSVGVGYLAEAYMNYGWTGLYLVSFFLGAFVTCVQRASVFMLGGPTLLAFFVLLIPLMPYSSDLGSMLNSLVLALCSLAALKFFITGNNARDAYGTAAATA